jgi:hypothetical protein
VGRVLRGGARVLEMQRSGEAPLTEGADRLGGEAHPCLTKNISVAQNTAASPSKPSDQLPPNERVIALVRSIRNLQRNSRFNLDESRRG